MAQIAENTLSSSLANAQILFVADFTRTADGTIPPGAAASILGSVSPNNDQDYWQFTLRAGDVVTFDVDATTGLDSQIFLYNPSQAFVQANDDGGALDPGSGTILDSFMTYTVPVGAAGTWYLGLQSRNGATGGNYILHISIQSPSQTLFGTSASDAVDGWMGNDNLYGYAAGLPGADTGNDTLNGLAGNDLIDGAGGADSLAGGDGVDTLLGGAGNDTLLGGVGADSLDGGAEADSLEGGDNADTILGAAGADTITGGAGADRMEGGEGDDHIWAVAVGNVAGTDADTLLGGGGNDWLVGNDGNNLLDGGTGNDTLAAWNGADTLLGGEGDDSLIGYAGNTRLDGGAGDDIVGSNASGGRTTMIGGDGADTVLGSFGIDSISGDTGDDSLRGLDDRDTLRGSVGNDVLDGGLGSDYLDGGTGNDTLFAGPDPAARDSLSGGAGADSIIGSQGTMLAYGGAGADTIIGGLGTDQVYGGDGDDIIIDTNIVNLDPDLIDGGAGNDTLTGSVWDSILGGDGNDTVNFLSLGNTGFGYRDGGAGIDTVVFPTPFPVGSAARLTQGLNGLARLEIVNVADSVVERSYEFRNFEGFWIEARGWTDWLEGGSGADSLDGGFGGNDSMYGYDGNDTLRAGGGAVLLLDGGAGNDDLTDDAGFDFASVLLLGGQGDDTIEARSDGLADGGEGNDSIYLAYLADVALQGGAGDDTVEIGYDLGASGAFVIASGGGGDDLLVFVHYEPTVAVEVTTDGVGGGEIFTSDGIVVFDGFERLRLDGNTQDDTLRGGEGADTLFGNGGANLFEAGGGDDLISGGLNDTVDGGAGTDTLWISVLAAPGNFTLAPPADATGIERYWLVSSAGNDSLTGASGADTLDGWIGNDTLDGAGGADSLVGGDGNDLFHVDDAGDAVLELSGGGADTVSASATHTLAAEVEALLLTGGADIGGTGNELANLILGNAGHNALLGSGGNDTLSGDAGADTLDGGAGADSLAGGAGADTYIVDNAGDVVLDNAGPDSDLVRASVTFTLPGNVERLELTGGGNIRGVGNSLSNAITGNTGNNLLQGSGGGDTLDGGGGQDTLDGGGGADRLTGGTGADAFRFAASSHGIDTVTDFTPGADQLHIVRSGFGNLLPLGALAPAQLVFGAAPVGAGAQLIYDGTTGTLRWDADGAGGAAPVTLALLLGGPALSAADILVVS